MQQPYKILINTFDYKINQPNNLYKEDEIENIIEENIDDFDITYSFEIDEDKDGNKLLSMNILPNDNKKNENITENKNSNLDNKNFRIEDLFSIKTYSIEEFKNLSIDNLKDKVIILNILDENNNVLIKGNMLLDILYFHPIYKLEDLIDIQINHLINSANELPVTNGKILISNIDNLAKNINDKGYTEEKYSGHEIEESDYNDIMGKKDMDEKFNKKIDYLNNFLINYFNKK